METRRDLEGSLIGNDLGEGREGGDSIYSHNEIELPSLGANLCHFPFCVPLDRLGSLDRYHNVSNDLIIFIEQSLSPNKRINYTTNL